ncbi:MAG: RNA polymerase sigma factor [Gaiellaceae bacterium]
MEGRPPTEEELVDRAQRGDVDAYERIVEAYQGIAVRVAYAVCGDAADAEDAAQEAFVKAFRALPRFRRGAPFRPWLLQIVANEGRNRRRSAGRRTQLALRTAAETRPGDAAPSPEAAVVGAEQRAELLAAVNQLRDEEREVVACRYFLELSEAETAEVLGLRTGTVKSRLSRALDHLRVALDA